MTLWNSRQWALTQAHPTDKSNNSWRCLGLLISLQQAPGCRLLPHSFPSRWLRSPAPGWALRWLQGESQQGCTSLLPSLPSGQQGSSGFLGNKECEGQIRLRKPPAVIVTWGHNTIYWNWESFLVVYKEKHPPVWKLQQHLSAGVTDKASLHMSSMPLTV